MRFFITLILFIVLFVKYPALSFASDKYIPLKERSPEILLKNSQFSSAGKKVWTLLIKEEDRLGRMPSLSEALSVMINSHTKLTQNDWVLFCFMQDQRPRLDAHEIEELYRTKKALLNNFKTIYQVKYLKKKQVKGTATSSGIIHFKNEFYQLSDELKFISDEYENNTLIDKLTESFDNGLLRGYRIVPEKSYQGYILEESNPARLIKSGNPLQFAYLLAAPQKLQNQMWVMKKITSESFVFEQPEVTNGLDCIVMGNLYRQLYLCPKYGYAVVKDVQNLYYYDSDNLLQKRSKPAIEVINSEFVELSRGVWLPKKSEFKWNSNEGTFENYITTVDSYELNPNTPNGFFTNIIPDGTHVIDGLQNTTYVLGKEKKRKIGDDLNNVTTSKTGSSFVLITINVLAFIVIAIVLMIRKTRTKN
tara:strand:+ start:5619 stop:6878 length:1260 start_codon:yes stop_codon:yes gene_type:complete